MACANNVSYVVKGIGKVVVTFVLGNVVTVESTSYVRGIHKILISISAIAICGYRVVFNGHVCSL